MTDLSTVDVGAAYRQTRERITSLLENATVEQWEKTVPHCPEWTVRQTIAHLSGVVDDALNNNMEGVTTEPWTQAQIDKRADISGEAILEEWNTYGPFVDDRATQLGMKLSRLLFDTVTHEHDIRYALGQPGGRDGDALQIAAGFLAPEIAGHVGKKELGPITFVVNGETLHDGGPDAVVLSTTLFDFVRSLGSRRSINQIRALNWSRDPGAIVEHLFPFSPPTIDIPE
jgi:uncharacterized protein (TIGR03083 family)